MTKSIDAIPTKEEIANAHERISSFIHRAPVLSNQTMNGLAGAELFFKCENFQKVGAFKFRGATNAILQLSEDEKRNGVVTHSSGNHAQALSLAAKFNGLSAYIVMPNNAPIPKRKAVAGYGAEIVLCEPTLEAREAAAKKVIERTGAAFIHPFNDYRVIAGAATAAKELIEDCDNLDYIIAPVGGGGLLSGTALTAKYFSPQTKVVGAEPEGANDAFLTFKSGEFVPQNNPNTVCDGLRTSLGDKTFRIILDHVNDVMTANDDEIIQAMRLVWERMKIIIEPSCAVTLAVVLKNPEIFRDKRIGLILTGGNVDLEKLPF